MKMKKIIKYLIFLMLIFPINIFAVTREEFNNAVSSVATNAATNYADEFVYSFYWGGSPSNPINYDYLLKDYVKQGFNGIKIERGYIYASQKRDAGIIGNFQNKFPVYCDTFVRLMVYHASGGKVLYDTDYETINIKDIQRGDLIHFPNHIAIYLDDNYDTSEYTWRVAEASSKVQVRVISNLPDKAYRVKESSLSKLDYNTVMASSDFHDRLDDYAPIINNVIEISNTNKINIQATDYKKYELQQKSDILEPENNGIIAYQVTKNNIVPTTDWIKVNKTDNLNVETTVDSNGLYYIWVKDVGGNVAYTSVNLTKIVVDRELPTLGTFSYDALDTSILVTISDAKDNNGIKEYRYYLDNKLIKTSSNNSYEIKNLNTNNVYNFYYEVVDLNGNTNKSPVYQLTLETDALKIEVKEDKLYLVKGKTYELNPKVTIDSTNYKIKYSSSDNNIVQVSSDGVIKALNPGNATITISVGKTKATINVKVSSYQIIFNLMELPVAYINKEYDVLIDTNYDSTIELETSLPNGLTLYNNKIVGIPKDNTSGSYDIIVHAKYLDSEEIRKYTLSIKYDIEILSASLKTGYLDNDYSEELKSNYDATFYIKEGNLPPGLSINKNKIEGIPKVSGTYKFTITAMYDNSIAEKELTIVIRNHNIFYYIEIALIIIAIGIIIYLSLNIKKSYKKQ